MALPNQGPIWNDIGGATAAVAAGGVALLAVNNLSDLTNVVQARLNLGLGTAALKDATAFDVSGAAAAALASAEAYARSLISGGGGSGFPFTLGSTSIAASSANPNLDGVIIGATTPANGTFTTLVGQLVEGLQSGNAINTLFYGQNTSAGNNAGSKWGLANDSQQLIFILTSTGYAGSPVITGGIAKSASFYTDSPVPLIFGTNNTARLTLAATGAMTVTGATTLSNLAAASGGVVLSSTAGLLSALAFTGSTSNFLRADGTFAAPAGAIFPASAQLITNVSNTPIATNGVFNVQAYGAKGDGNNHAGAEDTAVAAAITAAIASFSATNLSAVVYFPAGTYALTAAVTATIASPNTISFRGDGRLATAILQTSSGTNGITVNLSLSAGNRAYSSAEIRDLSVLTSTTSNVAIYVSFGTSALPLSSENFCGITIDNVSIETFTDNLALGWTNGIALINPWKYHITNINATGGANSNIVRSSGNVPLTSTATPGDGAFFYVTGGINGKISDVFGSFWQYGIYLDNGPNVAATSMANGGEYVIAVSGTTNWTSIGFASSTVGTLGTYNGAAITGSGGFYMGLACQGIFLRGINFVAVRIGLDQIAGAFMGPLICSEWQLDQGNLPNAGLVNIGINLGGSIGTACTSSFTGVFATQTGAGGTKWINLSHVSNSTFTACSLYTGGGVALANSSSNNVFSGCQFGGVALSCDGTCNNNQANNTQGSSTAGWTGVGTGNTVKTTLY